MVVVDRSGIEVSVPSPVAPEPVVVVPLGSLTLKPT